VGRLPIILLGIILPGSLFGQLLEFTVNNGLPSNTVYYILQDQIGYIWFATDDGVARYDGQSFEIFTKQDGLADNENFQILEDKYGRIWFGAFNGDPSYYDLQEQKFYNKFNQPWLREIELNGYIRQMATDEKGDLYLLGQLGGLAQITHYDSVINYSFPREIKPEGISLYGGEIRFLYIDRELPIPLASNDLGKVYPEIISEPRSNFSTSKTMDLPSRGVTLASLIGGRMVRYWDQKNSEHTLKKFDFPDSIRMINLAEHPDLGVWLIHFDGIRFYPWSSIESQHQVAPTSITALPGKTPSHVMCDSDGRLWISTLGDGVLLKPNSSLSPLHEQLNLPDSPVDIIPNDSLEWLFLLKNKQLWARPQGVNQLLLELPSATYYSRLIRGIAPSHVWNYNRQDLTRIDLGNGVSRFGSYASSMVEIPEGFILGHSGGVLMLPYDEFSSPIKGSQYVPTWPGDYRRGIKKKNLVFNNRAYSMLPITVDSILFGYQKGIALGSINTGQIVPMNPEQFMGKINSLIFHGDAGSQDWVWAGGDEVLFAFSQKDTVWAPKPIIRNTKISHLLCAGDSLLWLSTNRGVITLKVDLDHESIDYLGSLTTAQGLPSNDVSKTIRNEKELWIITKSGAVSIDIETLLQQKNFIPPTPHLEEIQLGDSILPPSTPVLEMSRDQTVVLKTAPLFFGDPGKLQFEFRLSQNGPWTPSNTADIQLVSLAPGEYNVEIRTVLDNGNASLPLAIPIRVRPPWWLTVWAIVGLIFLLALTFVGAIRWRNAITRQRAQNEIRLAQMELSVLKAQMNPHFIFNALSSIQRFVLSNDTKQANEYLTKYSRLTRMVLNHSDKTLVSLESELQCLRYYIELEALRLSHRFTYYIEIDDELDPAMQQIPPLLIQTFVENAIWHGLSPLPGQGVLELSFEKQGNMLAITVRDNGIGRKAAHVRNPRKGQSKGSQITLDKLSILNETLYHQQASIRLRDLYDDEGRSSGTEVIFSIPLAM